VFEPGRLVQIRLPWTDEPDKWSGPIPPPWLEVHLESPYRPSRTIHEKYGLILDKAPVAAKNFEGTSPIPIAWSVLVDGKELYIRDQYLQAIK